MIIGVILRNFKTYKNINYIPLSNGESFSGFIGANGIGKSSILEALDCFFNNRIWNVNVNRTSSGEESCYIVPIFCIEKDKIVKTEIKSLAEAYSNIIWSLMTSSLTPTFINANFKEFVEQIKKNLPPYATINSHYLLPLGEIDKDHRATHSIFRGETLLNSLNFPSSEMSTEKKYEYLAQKYLIPLKEYIKEAYNYIYIPKDIEPERVTRFETQEIQTLLGEKLENIVAKFITQKQIQDISNGLKGFINNLSNSLPSYKFRAASSYQPNLKPSTIYSLIIRDFFSVRTEIEDILNGKIFNDVLKDFKEEYPELLDFVVDQEKPELPSYFAMDLSPSQNDKLTQFFDNKPDNKVRFAQKYIEKAKVSEKTVPNWVSFLKEKLQQ